MPMSPYSEPSSFDSQFTPPVQYPSHTRSAQVFFPNNFNANDIPILNNQVKRYFNWISDKLYEAAKIN